MNPHYACGSNEHHVAQRSFLQGLVAGTVGWAGGFSGWLEPAAGGELATGGKRLLAIFMHGGLSQLESWDPKPGTATGGPFRAIPTTVPGLHISELLPYTAKQMHHLAVLRGLNTHENDHGRGQYLMQTGHEQRFAVRHPELGALAAYHLGTNDYPLPPNIKVVAQGGGGRSQDGGFLGPAYASTVVSGSAMPNWTERPGGLSEPLDDTRRRMRARLDQRLAARQGSAATAAYAESFDKALQLMEQRSVFDVGREPESDHERYGKTEFGQQCLLARRLLEHDVPCVQVTHSNYDTHNENFNFHLEHMAEFDRPFATLIADLADRGLLEHTLVLVFSEFGRTPRINRALGRDHWSKSWSVVTGGTGIQPGAVYGKTNEKGDEVVDGEIDQRHLHHTLLAALGIDPTDSFDVAGQSAPIADPSGAVIKELLT